MRKIRVGSIYIIRNKCNNKVYIGQTIQSVDERFRQHLKPSVVKQRGSYKIYNAINKYGKENFYFEILEENIPQEKLDDLEIKYIESFDSYENGYNSTTGADNKTISKIQDVEKLIELFDENLTYQEIANYFNVNKATIQRTLKSLGCIKFNKVTKKYLLENKDIKTNKQMAEELNVHPYTITRAFKKFKIPRGIGISNHMNPQNKSKVIKEDLLKYFHLSNIEIGEKLNICTSYVSKLLKKYNIPKK